MVAERVPDILRTVDTERYFIKDAPKVIRLVVQGFSDEAVADTGIELAEGAGITVAAIVDAVLSITAAVVLLAVILGCAITLMFYNQIRDYISKLPIIGGPLASIFDLEHAGILVIATWLDNEAHSRWNGLIKKVHDLVAGLIAIFGLPSLSQIQKIVAQTHATLARLPYDVDALENRVMKALSDTLANLWINVGQIWHWIHVALAHINDLIHAVHEIWTWIHSILYQIASLANLVKWLINQVSQIWKTVHHLINLINYLQKQVNELQKETKLLQQRIVIDEAAIAPALETAAIGALLLPLIETGPVGIANLAKLADDPCFCLTTPGGKGFLETALLAYLAWKNDP